jgi:PAS domain S-box-containing protein
MSTTPRNIWIQRLERDLPEGSVFRSVFVSSRTVMFLLDPETGAIIGANPAACAFYGYDADELECLELTAVSLLPKEDILELLAGLVRGEAARLPSRHRLKSGELRDVQLDAASIALRSGRRCLFFIVHDVTALAQAERSLRQREGLLRAILDCAGDGIAFRDAAGMFREANPAFCSMLGRPRNCVVGQDDANPLDRRTSRCAVELERRLGDEQVPSAYEITLDDTEEARHLSVHKSPVIDAAGEYLGTVFVGRDTTEQRKSEGLLRAMLESAQDSIVVTDVHDILREANPTFLGHMGRSRGELLGSPLEAMFQGEELHLQISTNALARETREPVSFIQHIQRPNLDRWLNVVKNAVVDSEGRCLGVVSFGRDITDQKNAENALRQSERRLSSLIRQAPVGVFETDNRGRLTFANERMQRLSGRNLEALIGERWLEAVHPEDREGFLARWRQTLAQRQEFDEELRLLHPRSGVIWVSARVRPMRDAARHVSGYLGVFGDITERKKAEAMRSDVESVVRHDLKSPLASVQNALELLGLLGSLNDEQSQILVEVRGLTRRMLGLIALSVDLHAIEAGVFVPRSEPIDLCEVIDGLRAEMRALVEGKGLTLNLITPCAGAPFPILGERRLVDAIFSNLLKNAAEAAPENSEISVRLWAEGREAAAAVRNLGEVPQEIRGRFFEKYATFGKAHGTGLGTYSARLMVRTLGGRVTLDVSEPGATTLTVHLPLPQQGA